MPDACLLCYITDRTAFAADEPTRRRRLLEKIAEAARTGVDYIQLREKDLSTRELASLAREAMRILNQLRIENRELRTALLVNSRTDVAIAAAADGVHLRSDDISPHEVKQVWQRGYVGTAAPGCPAVRSTAVAAPASPAPDPLIAVSCHSPEEVNQAAVEGASFAVFAPVFEKKDVPGMAPAGLEMLREACTNKIPVLALGGVKLSNARSCLQAGAAGIAAIRLFQENNIAEIARGLRQI